jgi:hyperosmotically inducible periplasmic protein
MKAAIGSVVVAAALIVAGQVPMHAVASAAQSTATTTAKSSDAALASKIEKKLHGDSLLKKYTVKVTVHDGVATLVGTVPTEADRAKAAQMASIDGVSRVDNQIVVDLNAPAGTSGKIDTAADKTKKGVDKAIDKSAEGVNTATEKSKEGAAKAADKSAGGIAKAGEAVTDTFIKTRVKSKFADEDLLKGSDISVEVKDHVVTLSGTVPSAAGRARAIEQAKEVDGVQRVIDRMTIK